jgi:threonine synthase
LLEEGILAEGAGAATVAALYSIKKKKHNNICSVITGSGLKNSLKLKMSLNGK